MLYFSGAIGVLTTPLGANVWEVTPKAPLGNQLVAPAGAQAAGGGTDYTARNFRRAVVIGEQLSEAVERLLAHASSLTETHMSYAIQPFTTRLSNFGFRVLLVIDPATGRSQLGHEPGPLLVCPDAPANYTTCTPDGFAQAHDDLVDVDHRVGDHLESAVEYLKIGPVGMMFLPGEMSGELVNGLPAAFRTTPEKFYAEPPGTHAFGDALDDPRFREATHARSRTSGRSRSAATSSATSFRSRISAPSASSTSSCPADARDCTQSGDIEFPDAVAGATCKQVTEDPAALEGRSALAVLGITASCKYGQALGEANGHYEETNSGELGPQPGDPRFGRGAHRRSRSRRR